MPLLDDQELITGDSSLMNPLQSILGALSDETFRSDVFGDPEQFQKQDLVPLLGGARAISLGMDQLEEASNAQTVIGKILRNTEGTGNIALGASDFVLAPFPIVGAIKGIKKLPLLFHGSHPSNIPEILGKGFQRGHSAEVNTAGTSLSEDPLVSYQGFGYKDPLAIIGADPLVDLSMVVNVRPSEYALHSNLTTDPTLIRKPNLFYNENETLAIRNKEGVTNVKPRELKPHEEKHLINSIANYEAHQNSKEELLTMFENMSNMRNAGERPLGRKLKSIKNTIANYISDIQDLKSNRGTYERTIGYNLSKISEATFNLSRVAETNKEFVQLSEITKRAEDLLEKRVEAFNMYNELQSNRSFHLHGSESARSTGERNFIERNLQRERDNLDKFVRSYFKERDTFMDDLQKLFPQTTARPDKKKAQAEAETIVKATRTPTMLKLRNTVAEVRSDPYKTLVADDISNVMFSISAIRNEKLQREVIAEEIKLLQSLGEKDTADILLGVLQ